MSVHERVLRLVDAIYGASVEPSSWSATLELLCNELSGASACLLRYDGQSAHALVEAAVRFDPEGARVYSSYYSRLDPWARALVAQGRLRTGTVCTGESLVPFERLKNTEFLNDYGLPYGAVHNVFAVQFGEADTGFVLTVLRPYGAAAFGTQAVNILSTLAPHFARAIEVQHRVQGGGTNLGLDALEMLEIGVVLLGALGQPVFLNGEARRIVKQADALLVARGRLVAAHSEDRRTLARLIDGAVGHQQASNPRRGGTALLRRPSQRALAISVAPLPTQTDQRGLLCAPAVVFVVDPARRRGPMLRHLRDLYGLTAAEAKLAVQLARGDSLRDASDQFGVCLSTVRSHLKRVLEKTGTSRQAQLVSLLLGASPLPAGADDDV